MKSVEQLDVFKLAHELALRVYKVTVGFPKEEKFSLVLQMRRAASSVGMNLVDGSMRLNSRECRQFVGIASVVRHKSLDFDCHSERSEESRLFKYMRPFTSFRVTSEDP